MKGLIQETSTDFIFMACRSHVPLHASSAIFMYFELVIFYVSYVLKNIYLLKTKCTSQEKNELKHMLQYVSVWIFKRWYNPCIKCMFFKRHAFKVSFIIYISCLFHFSCRLQSIAVHRDHFVRRLSVRPSVCLSVCVSVL